LAEKKKKMRPQERTERIATLQREIARSRRRIDRRVTSTKERASGFIGNFMFPKMISPAIIGGAMVVFGWLFGRKSKLSFNQTIMELATSPTPWRTLWNMWNAPDPEEGEVSPQKEGE
jgi:hypothetical protein